MQGGDRDSLGVRLPQEFDAFFGKATGHEPYEYQRALARAPSPPSVLDVPTGSGKTQGALAAWMYQRLVGRSTPRRLVYALPMRTLVEQTLGVAEDMRRKLELATDDLPIHVLMGGAEPESDWRLSPERAQILVGTIDMLLSRALNRGYGESRFAWPVSFGLLNADCRWVFDELQLMGPARATSAQLDGLRRTVGTDLGCETMWMSATVDQSAVLTVDRPELGEVLALQSSDRTARLAQRLHARKIVRRVEPRDIDPRSRSGSIAHTTIDHHQEGTRTLVVLNTVERAQQVARILRRELVEREDPPNVALLHSRYRPQDRDQHVLDALAPVDERCAGVIVVATQVVEAGVDLSSRTLITDLAPFSSIVQRLGRCNRFGEFREATVLWLDPGELPAGKRGREVAAPYLIPDLERSRAALLPLEGESLSPDVLAQLEVEEEVDDPTVLRRRDLLDLFDTSPDLSGLDVDVAPFIREDDDRNVMVFFRELGAEPAARVTEAAPGRLELVQVPRSSLGKRNRWVLDHVEGEWVRQDRVPPGATVMLAAGDGGYHSLEGWDPALKEPVAPVPEAEGPAAEGYGDDPLSVKQMPQELLRASRGGSRGGFHLGRAARARRGGQRGPAPCGRSPRRRQGSPSLSRDAPLDDQSLGTNAQVIVSGRRAGRRVDGTGVRTSVTSWRACWQYARKTASSRGSTPIWSTTWSRRITERSASRSGPLRKRSGHRMAGTVPASRSA